MRSKKLEPIGKIINRLAKRDGWYQYFLCVQLKTNWKEIVGENISNHTNPVKIVFKKLFVEVDQPIWAAQLNLVKHKIIQQINEFIGQRIITDIYFKVVDKIFKNELVWT